MTNRSVRGKTTRIAAKAMLDETLRMIDTGEIKGMQPEEVVAHLVQFASNSTENELESKYVDDVEGREIKERFWRYGAIAAAEPSIVLRELAEEDRSAFLQIRQAYATYPVLMKNEAFQASLWNQYLDHTALILAIVKDGRFVGYCGIENTAKAPWEISIELLPEWTHKGIGFAAIGAMLEAMQERLGVTEFRVRIDPSNVASQSLFEKLGAKPNGISSLLLRTEEEIHQCEEENLPNIDETLVAVAEKFGVEPRKLLSHVLEYKLRR